MSGPAFGSPAWRALYGKGKSKATAGAAAPAKPMQRTSGRGRPGAPKRPQPSLSSVVSSLKAAAAEEPEVADKAKLENALSIVEEVASKNSSEEA